MRGMPPSPLRSGPPPARPARPAPPLARLARLAHVGRLVLAAAAVPTAGCYRYVPSPAVAAMGVAGGTVRLRLGDDAAARASEQLGTRTASVAGRLADLAGDSLVLVVTESWPADGGAPVRWVGERVTLARGGVTAVETRALDRRRSLLVVGGAVLAIVGSVLALRAVSGEAGGETIGGGGPPP